MALLLAVMVQLWGAQEVPSRPLQIGEMLPTLSGATISNKKLELPANGTGKSRVLVFSFSKAASADSRLWTQRLLADPDLKDKVVSYRVIVLESVPKLFRGMAVSGIKSGMPTQLWDTTILLYKDEQLWKKRLAITADNHSYVALIDGGGRLRWLSSSPFSEANYTQLKGALR